ncbi:piggyBac transposable element-derived protein 4-like [Hylaeus volcanicus]|uniref:piggyBac transposable element-derived protein 4-like n=1 Tax=Hylaeus volcanicus TaxID=313075 RepID=UPI0023B7A4D8|nr:piggyBac transposable element-derived protein 4-like [Hylaeus volcanicus]
MSRAIISDVDSIASDSEDGERTDTRSDDNIILTHQTKRLRIESEHYIPNQQLSIDESLVGTHCHSAIKQYIPNKKHHKFWMLCESIFKYCLRFFCYKRAKTTDDRDLVQKYGLGFTVVQKLFSIGNYLHKGYHLFTDNFYTSLHLAKALLKQNTYLIGTIRRNRKEIPPEAKKAIVGEAKYMAHENILMCSFGDKQSKPNPVILISSNSDTNSVTIKKKKGNHEIKHD